MKLIRKVGATSEIWQIFIRDSSSTTGAGLTGLTNASSGLTAYYHRDTDTTATAISLASMTVGTFTSSGFKEIDSTNMPGWYQFCPPNTALASGAKSCAFHLKGATNMAPLPIEVDLDSQVDVTHWNGTAVKSPTTAGVPEVCMTDAVAHGGTLGSSTATFALSRLNVTSQTTNTPALTVTGNGTGDAAILRGGATSGTGLYLIGGTSGGFGLAAIAQGGDYAGISVTGIGAASGIEAQGGSTGNGVLFTGGANGSAMKLVGGSVSGHGLLVITTSGDAFNLAPTAGHGVNIAANGTSKHGVFVTGGTAGTSDGFKAVAGSGGVAIRGDITGNITGSLSGSVASVTAGVTVATNNDKTGYSLTITPAVAGDAMTLTSAYDFAKGTVAATESYSTDGSPATPIQMLYLIMQTLTEFTISGTTYRINKLNGSNQAAALTLNDATSPTAATRSA